MKSVTQIVIAVLLGVAAFGAQAQTKITLGHIGIADYLSVFVVHEEGLFGKNGVLGSARDAAFGEQRVERNKQVEVELV